MNPPRTLVSCSGRAAQAGPETAGIRRTARDAPCRRPTGSSRRDRSRRSNCRRGARHPVRAVSGARTAPVISTVPSGSSAAICASASGFAREEERECRFRPDQMRDIAQAGRVRAARAIGEREIAAHHLLLSRVVEFLVLLQIGLHDAKVDAFDVARRRPRPAGPRRRRQVRRSQPRSVPEPATDVWCRRGRRRARPATNRSRQQGR